MGRGVIRKGQALPARDGRGHLLKLEQHVCAVQLDDDLIVFISCQINAEIIPRFKGVDVVEAEKGFMSAGKSNKSVESWKPEITLCCNTKCRCRLLVHK